MGKRLLLADDSITIQKVVGIIFANEDYDLTVVGNGTVALEKAKELSPDIILVDALMPGRNGYEVCEEIRRDPALAHTPLLLMTGAFEPFDEDKARQCGADDFISKPFESQQLIDKVRTLMALGSERAQKAPAMAAAPAAPPLAEITAAAVPAAAPQMAAATEAVFAAPVVAAAGVAAAAGTAEEIFTVTEEGGEEFFAEELTAADEVVEVSPGEDLWGAFEVEEVSEAEEFAIEEIAEAKPAGAAAAPAEDFFFGEVEVQAPVSAGAPPPAAPQEYAQQFVPVEEETFTFAEEPQAADPDIFPEPGSFGVAPASDIPGIETAAEFLTSGVQSPPGTPPVGAPAGPEFAFEEEYVLEPAAAMSGAPEELAAEEIFSFAEEEVASAATMGQPVPVEPSAEEFFSFAEEETPVAATALAAAPEVSESEEFFSFAEEVPVAAAAVPTEPAMEPVFAPEEEYVPVMEPASPPISATTAGIAAMAAAAAVGATAVATAGAQPAAPVTLQPAASGELTLSEEQLASLVSRISRELIEKIAWEVVPDLAESIIRAEIRKIKEGA
jgi:CheY-like chemotaxis protein